MLLPAVRIEIPLELAVVCLLCRKVTTRAHVCVGGDRSLLELKAVVTSMTKEDRGEVPEPLLERVRRKRRRARSLTSRRICELLDGIPA